MDGLRLSDTLKEKLSCESETLPDKKYKYLQYMETLPTCPCPINFSEIKTDAYRWIKKNDLDNSFLPLSIAKNPPPRLLDNSDKLCSSYGLSMFKTLKQASIKYQKVIKHTRTHLKSNKINELGKEIAHITLNTNDGKSGDFDSATGHFTFHEYDTTNLGLKIQKTFNIFDNDGKYITHE